MANKDGVARGGTRFNLRGKDLNRNWDFQWNQGDSNSSDPGNELFGPPSSKSPRPRYA